MYSHEVLTEEFLHNGLYESQRPHLLYDFFFLIAGIIDACLCFILDNLLTGRQVLFVKVIKLCTTVLCIYSCTKPNKPLYL